MSASNRAKVDKRMDAFVEYHHRQSHSVPPRKRPSKIILAGTGTRTKETFAQLDKVLTPTSEKQVAYIITAALMTHHSRSSRFNDDSDARQRVNKKCMMLEERFRCKVDMIDLADPKIDVKSRLQGVDVIFVEGGNTYYLRHHMRKSGFDRVVKRELLRGATYVGCSAGAIVTGEGIGPALWKNNDLPSAVEEKIDWTDPELQKGLGLLPRRFIFPHFAPKYHGMVERKKAEGHHIEPIPDNGVQVFTVILDEHKRKTLDEEKSNATAAPSDTATMSESASEMGGGRSVSISIPSSSARCETESEAGANSRRYSDVQNGIKPGPHVRGRRLNQSLESSFSNRDFSDIGVSFASPLGGALNESTTSSLTIHGRSSMLNIGKSEGQIYQSSTPRVERKHSMRKVFERQLLNQQMNMVLPAPDRSGAPQRSLSDPGGRWGCLYDEADQEANGSDSDRSLCGSPRVLFVLSPKTREKFTFPLGEEDEENETEKNKPETRETGVRIGI